MKKYLNKFFSSIVLLIFVLFVSFTLVSCNDNKTNDSKYTIEDLESLVFEDTTFVYDGAKHGITIENIPEGIEVRYVDNECMIPGEYEVKAVITFENLKVTKTATLTISKAESLLSASTEQTFVLYGGNIKPVYELSNKIQSVSMKYYLDGKEVSKEDTYKPGTYEVEMYAAENMYYLESNHITVTVNVIESQFDISFESSSFIADGTEKTIVLSGNLPTEYTVEYENNSSSEVGTYYAKAYIKDASGSVVETHAAVMEIDNPKNEEFDKYLDEFFVEYLEEDQLSVNIFCENPEDFGLSHYEASWYEYDSFDSSDVAEAKAAQFEGLLEELYEFKDAKLNDLQQVSYNNIEKFLKYYIEYYNIPNVTFMNITYVDQFGGYVADFGTYMEAYSLRSELEVQDIVNYISSTKTAFPSYLKFIEDKANAGFPLSNYTITEMRSYLSDVLEQGDNYYLKDILNEKIDGLAFLSAESKESYKSQIADAISNCFIVGVEGLYNGLETHLDKLAQEDEGYWSVYENGKVLYELELEDLLGFDINMEEYMEELDKSLSTAIGSVISKQSAVMKQFNVNYAGIEIVMGKNPIFDGTPDEMVGYLKEFAKSIVPELKSNPDISIKNMDPASAKVSNAVAYYMKSALDNSAGEHITLNPLKLGDKNDVLGTMAHEGYPGHLYAYVYSKELDLHNLSKIMTSTAHGEGWATYVELALYEYAKKNSDDPNFKILMDYLYANQICGFLLETRLDAGIHYQGWNVADVARYMERVGYVSDGAQDIYNLLIETPTQYAAYGYGKLKMVNIHNEAKKVLGGFYDEIEFNAMLLSKGWTNLGELQNTYEDYMNKKCHECGIVFKK